MQKICFSAGSAPVPNRSVMQPGHTAKTGSVPRLPRHTALAGHKPAAFSLHCSGTAQTLFCRHCAVLFCFFLISYHTVPASKSTMPFLQSAMRLVHSKAVFLLAGRPATAGCSAHARVNINIKFGALFSAIFNSISAWSLFGEFLMYICCTPKPGQVCIIFACYAAYGQCIKSIPNVFLQQDCPCDKHTFRFSPVFVLSLWSNA